jgi:ribosome-binding factor A
MRSYKRADRVSELIHAEMVGILRDIKELNHGLLTVTKVKLTDDLQTCRIFYSVIGTQEDKESVDKVLKENLKHIRFQLANSVDFRRTPTIEFKYDSSAEEAIRVFELLDKIKQEK